MAGALAPVSVDAQESIIPGRMFNQPDAVAVTARAFGGALIKDGIAIAMCTRIEVLRFHPMNF